MAAAATEAAAMDASDELGLPEPHSNSPRAWQRFYMGFQERFVKDAVVPLPNGAELRLCQAPSAKAAAAAANGRRQQQQQQQQQQLRAPPVRLQQGKPAQQKQKRGGQQQQQQQQQQQLQLDKAADPALTGSTVWDGAVVLSQFLACQSSPLAAAWGRRQEGQGQPQRQPPQQPQQPQQQPHLQQQRPLPVSLELGAGTGGVSLALLAAGLVRRAVITDLPDMLPHLRRVVAHNAGVVDTSRAVVLPLRWGEPDDVEALRPWLEPPPQQQQPGQQGADGSDAQCAGSEAAKEAVAPSPSPPPPPPLHLHPDVIVGSDLVYYSYTEATPHSRLLLTALAQLAGPRTDIYLALSMHHNPEEVRNFLRWAAEDWGFVVEPLGAAVPAEYRVWDVLVVRLRLADAAAAAAAAAAARAGTLVRPY